jgi:signal recognition particle subunit SRP68
MPLVSAERAWAHAMELKKEAANQPRKRMHLIKRLRKASLWASQLARCDAGTADVERGETHAGEMV